MARECLVGSYKHHHQHHLTTKRIVPRLLLNAERVTGEWRRGRNNTQQTKQQITWFAAYRGFLISLSWNPQWKCPFFKIFFLEKFLSTINYFKKLKYMPLLAVILRMFFGTPVHQHQYIHYRSDVRRVAREKPHRKAGRAAALWLRKGWWWWWQICTMLCDMLWHSLCIAAVAADCFCLVYSVNFPHLHFDDGDKVHTADGRRASFI